MQLSDNVDLRFFYTVFRNYWGHISLYAIYFVAILHALDSRDSKYRNIYGYGAIAALLTVFNPLIAIFFVKKLDLSTRYYRFYWILPVAQLTAMFMVHMINNCKQRLLKITAFCFSVIIIILCGKIDVYDISASKSNIYKIDNDTIEVSGIIHSYVPDADRIRAYYGEELLSEIRTYDASIYTLIGRYEHANYPFSGENLENAMRDDNYLLLTLMEFYAVEFPPERVLSAFDEYGVNCYIRQKDRFSSEYIDSLGLKLIGETQKYQIYWYK